MIHRLGIGVWVGLLLVSQGWAQRTISWQELHQIAEGCVRSHVGALPIEIEWIGDGPRQLTVSRDVTELRCMSDSSLVAQGRFVIEAWTHGQWAGRFVLSGKVWVTASELRLCKPIRAGQMLTMADVESSPRRMRLSEYWQRLRAEEVGKVRVRRDLPAGAPVFREDCLLYSAVRRGDRVTVIARAGNVEVRTVAQALEEGEPGRWIRVRREGAGRILSARVVDATTVVVGQAEPQP